MPGRPDRPKLVVTPGSRSAAADRAYCDIQSSSVKLKVGRAGRPEPLTFSLGRLLKCSWCTHSGTSQGMDCRPRESTPLADDAVSLE